MKTANLLYFISVWGFFWDMRIYLFSFICLKYKKVIIKTSTVKNVRRGIMLNQNQKKAKSESKDNSNLVFTLNEFEQASAGTATSDTRGIFFYHLFDFKVGDSSELSASKWETRLRTHASVEYIYGLLQGFNYKKFRKESRGVLILVESIWERTRDVYKSVRTSHPYGRFVSKEMVRRYILTHKSIRILGKNGKRRNSNKSQFLQVRRSMLELPWIPVSEKNAERIMRLHDKMIIATGESHIYLYGEITYEIVSEFLHEGVVDKYYSVPEQQQFGSHHLMIQELYDKPDSWYSSLNEFINRIKSFMERESVEIVSGSFDLIVRTFNDEKYWKNR